MGQNFMSTEGDPTATDGGWGVGDAGRHRQVGAHHRAVDAS